MGIFLVAKREAMLLDTPSVIKSSCTSNHPGTHTSILPSGRWRLPFGKVVTINSFSNTLVPSPNVSEKKCLRWCVLVNGGEPRHMMTFALTTRFNAARKRFKPVPTLSDSANRNTPCMASLIGPLKVLDCATNVI